MHCPACNALIPEHEDACRLVELRELRHAYRVLLRDLLPRVQREETESRLRAVIAEITRIGGNLVP